MNPAHLTEAQLQSYADDMEIIGIDLKAHVSHCAHCQVKLENYRLMNQTLKAMPAPAFDFDLAETVSARIVARKTSVAWIQWTAAVAAILLLAFIAAPYARQIAAWFALLPKAWGYVLTVPALVLLAVHLLLSVTEHQRKMNLLTRQLK